MAFDAGMLASVISEIKSEALGAKIEKIHQPEKDQIVILTRSISGGRKLLIDAGANNPRIGFSFTQKENPMTPPMFCMLLRKHLTGARLTEIIQPGFERVAMLIFETYDEMGFPCKRKLIAEVMGKYSNLIFTNENDKIIALLKTVDFTTSSLRQLLPGMTYEMPPKQEKTNPLEADFESFSAEYNRMPKEKGADKFITAAYLGISASLAREIVFRATRHTDTPLNYCSAEELWQSFSAVMEQVFSIPGIGQYMLSGVNQRDRPVVCGCVIFFAGFTGISMLVMDLCYAFLDPRIKAQYSSGKKVK